MLFRKFRNIPRTCYPLLAALRPNMVSAGGDPPPPHSFLCRFQPTLPLTPHCVDGSFLLQSLRHGQSHTPPHRHTPHNNATQRYQMADHIPSWSHRRLQKQQIILQILPPPLRRPSRVCPIPPPVQSIRLLLPANSPTFHLVCGRFHSLGHSRFHQRDYVLAGRSCSRCVALGRSPHRNPPLPSSAPKLGS